ncbi:Cell division protein FtsI/penicillin-binding protein 2 [Clostridium cavendishii DSM 21758]|uniref:Cell division protein FtsI/penicillin-binding protein 2 n=1 Tax=Clostridium cavendishii DSM 21758 TaxID=1121302 RepID=A0A1M6KEC4_9CLOT|nr:penicillin-binding protein 2 [Clostridium cavendishii]SHJ57177.1 Cell division protein FtsI/penicillin-binding protein 2 [Clostridium cavendishii DSM 21758]
MLNNNKIEFKRIRAYKWIVFGIFLLLIVRLYYLQNKYNLVAETSSDAHNFQSEKISDTNFLLLDDKGRDLSDYNKSYVLIIDLKPFKLNNVEQNLQNLMAFNFIMKSEDKDFSFDKVIQSNKFKLYYKISEDSYNKIKELKNLKGIYCYRYDETQKKESWKIENMIIKNTYYDGGRETEKSVNSLEQKLNGYIKDNKVPQAKFSLDANSIYNEEKFDISDKNLNIQLTLDRDLQEKIRSILNSDKYKEFKNIGAVVVEAKTGKIRALAQKNESMPNLITGAGGGYGYDPGSIFKIITEEAALEYGNVNLNEKYTCAGQKCKGKIHGTLTVRQALDVSCNYVFSKLGDKVGEDKIVYLAKKQGLFSRVLGLDEKTMESAGQEPQEKIGIDNLSIGQSLYVTPLQMVGMLSSVVNNGKYVKPYLVDSTVNQKGEVANKFNTTYEQVISPTTARLVRDNMIQVVEKGTGINAMIKGVEIGGKTGTAETVNEGKKDFHGWFIGFLKQDNNYYTIAVMVPNIGDKNENGDNTVGGNTATPVFKEIVQEIIKK